LFAKWDVATKAVSELMTASAGSKPGMTTSHAIEPRSAASERSLETVISHVCQKAKDGALVAILLEYNGMDRSCAATIYPVLDKPLNSEALGAQGPLLKEICPLVFKIPFAIRLDRR